MTDSSKASLELPAWFREAMTEGEPTYNTVVTKRQEPRTTACRLISAQKVDSSDSKLYAVKLWNTSEHGVCLVARVPFGPGERLKLTPENGADQPVHISVAHCTQTIQGFLIGCAIESA